MIDLRTIMALTIGYSLIVGIGIIPFSINRDSAKGFIQIGFGIITYGCGFLILSFRNYLSVFITVIIANFLIVIGNILILQGMYIFRNVKFNWKLKSIPLIALYFLGFYYFTYISSNVNARIIIITLIVTYTFADIMVLFIKNINKINSKPSIIIIGFFASSIIISLLRIIITLNNGEIHNFMNAGFIHSLSVIIYQIMPFVLSIGGFWISNAEMENEMKTLMMTDFLTGLYNRSAFLDLAEIELARSKRYDFDIGVVMCDVDHFKKINDNFGHQIGDLVLKRISYCIKHNVRKEDIVGRFGGEEFIIILPGINEDHLKILMEKLRKIVELDNFDNFDLKIKYTISMGGTILKSGNKLDIAIGNADNALYKAKNSGRNKVEIYNEN